MKTFLRFTAVAIVLAVLPGCNTNPSAMDRDKAQKIADKMTYIKDTRTNLCYAAVAARKTGDTDQSGFTITWVPCTSEVERLAAKQ